VPKTFVNFSGFLSVPYIKIPKQYSPSNGILADNSSFDVVISKLSSIFLMSSTEYSVEHSVDSSETVLLFELIDSF